MQQYSSSIPNLFTDTIAIPSRGSAIPFMYYKPVKPSAKCYVFFNGMGETSGPVSGLAKYGPLSAISASFQPDWSAFCIQGVGWASVADQQAAYLKLKTLLGFSQIVLTGISEGAMLATEILMRGITDPIVKDTVAFIPMSSQGDDSVNKPVVGSIVSLKIPVCGVGDMIGDIHGLQTEQLIQYLKTANTSGNYIFVNTPGTGHGGWLADYSSTSVQYNGGNIYTWSGPFFSSGTVVNPPIPPVVKTITSATIGFSDGTSYKPTKIIKSIVINYTDGTNETKP